MPALSEIRLKIPRDLMLQVKKLAKDEQRTAASWLRALIVNELTRATLSRGSGSSADKATASTL